MSSCRSRFGVTPGTPGVLCNARLLQSAVTTTIDSLWQIKPPRLLEYSPRATHSLGWMPLFAWNNLGVTVFASWELHVQTALLMAWTLLLQVTGLGLSPCIVGRWTPLQLSVRNLSTSGCKEMMT